MAETHSVPRAPAGPDIESNLADIETVALSIASLRGQRVILDSSLAALYGVETKRFNEQIKRNAGRFPQDFMFRLTADETSALRSQNATLNSGRGQHRKYLPFAFSEHGALMAAMVVNSPRAVEVSVYVVRAFVRLREAAVQHKDLAERLIALEEKTEHLATQHDAFSHNTRLQLRQLFDALRELTSSQTPAPKRPIGFVHPDEKNALQNRRGTKAS